VQPINVLAALRRRCRPSQDGFTLVELMASLTVMSVGILAATRVMDTSFYVASQGGNRARAVALATREAEAMRAVPYDSLGFSPTQPGYATVFEGGTTVVVASPQIQPTGPDQTTAGETYHFQREIVWADAAAAGNPTSTFSQAYKHVTAIVTWADHGGTHTDRQDAFVYPGGQGPYTGPASQGGSSSSTSPNCPAASNLVSTPPAVETTATKSIVLTWTPPLDMTYVSAWTIRYSTDVFLTSTIVTDSQPPAVSTFTVTGLSPSTTYAFEVAAQCGTSRSDWTSPSSATTTSAAATGCQLGSVLLTPSAVIRADGSSMTLVSDAVLSVNTAGTCVGLRATYSPTTGTSTSVFLNTTNGGNQVATINGQSQDWDVGTHTITVTDVSNTPLATANFVVCSHNAKTCP